MKYMELVFHFRHFFIVWLLQVGPFERLKVCFLDFSLDNNVLRKLTMRSNVDWYVLELNSCFTQCQGSFTEHQSEIH